MLDLQHRPKVVSLYYIRVFTLVKILQPFSQSSFSLETQKETG